MARAILSSCVSLQTTVWATATWSLVLEETGACPATLKLGWASVAPPAAAPWGRPGGTPARRAPLSIAVSMELELKGTNSGSWKPVAIFSCTRDGRKNKGKFLHLDCFQWWCWNQPRVFYIKQIWVLLRLLFFMIWQKKQFLTAIQDE